MKVYQNPEMTVLLADGELRTDVISVSSPQRSKRSQRSELA